MNSRQTELKNRIQVQNLTEHLKILKRNLAQLAEEDLELQHSVREGEKRLAELEEEFRDYGAIRQSLNELRNALDIREKNVSASEEALSKSVADFERTKDAEVSSLTEVLSYLTDKIKRNEDKLEKLHEEEGRLDGIITTKRYKIDSLDDRLSELSSEVNRKLTLVEIERKNKNDEVDAANRTLQSVYQKISDARAVLEREKDDTLILRLSLEGDLKKVRAREKDCAVIAARLKKLYKNMYPDRELRI